MIKVAVLDDYQDVFQQIVETEKYKEKWCNYKVKMSDNLFIKGFIGWIYYLFQKNDSKN